LENSLKRGNGMYGGMYGGGGSGTSYIRRADEDEVYAVDGFLTFSFNQQFNAFRNQTIARFDKSNVNKFTFKYPGDSSFTVNFADKKWMIDNQKLDSAKISDYLSAMAYKSSNSFNDNFIPSASAQCQLTFEGKNMKTVNIDAYMLGNDEYVLNSNQNSKSWFTSKYKGIFSDIFKNKKSFITEKKKK